MHTADPVGCSLNGTGGSNHAGGHRCFSLVSVVCCQVEVLATGRSLVQRSRIERGVSECNSEIHIQIYIYL